MFRENGFTPQEAVTTAVKETIEPWQKAGLELPHLVVSEVARMTGLRAGTVIRIVFRSKNLMLEDLQGQPVNGNLREAAVTSAPIKKVVRVTQKEGRSFEQTAFGMGLNRLHIRIQGF
ncbi:hypothetical protein HYS95_00195 [Candidatus Daviesbacteria bacterium]|nr:hypothetical protein [Candidatus Daviesbacteria bacterium]